MEKSNCLPGCPFLADAWTTDDTLRVTHGLGSEEILIDLKIYGIVASSLLLIGLMVKVLGNKVIKPSGLSFIENVVL